MLLPIFLAGLAVNHVRAQLEYNYTLSASSPLLLYSPQNESSRSPLTGWSSNTATRGLGTGTYYTNMTSAQVRFSFYGTGFVVLGALEGGTTSMTVDDRPVYTPPTASDGDVRNATSSARLSILAQAMELNLVYHNVTLSFRRSGESGNGGMEIHGVQLTTELEGDGVNALNATVSALEAFGGSGQTLTSYWDWSGTWTPRTSDGSNYPAAFGMYSNSAVSIPIPVPYNISLVLLYGAIEPDVVSYYVRSVIANGSASGTAGSIPVRYPYAVRSLADEDVLLYAGQWPQGSAGNISLGATFQPSGAVGVRRAVFVGSSNATFWDPDASPEKKGSIVGAVVGGVVGGVVVILIACGVWYWKKRRSSATMSKMPSHPMDIDNFTHSSDALTATPAPTSVTPFQTHSRGFSRNRSSPTQLHKLKSPFADPSPSLSPSPSTSTPAVAGPRTPLSTTSHTNLLSARLEDRAPLASPNTDTPASETGHFQHKWEVLQELHTGPHRSASPNMANSSSSRPWQPEVDAGRVDEAPPPGYNPAWRQ